VFDRITFNSKGRACIRHTAISVSFIIERFAKGESLEEVLSNYPDLCREDLKQALSYAASVAQDRPPQ